ncbi:helix-turn-helix domain-containing protein [Streptomyces sp. NPDC046203]|uniref:helix-turn-helix domain-containing protein n=1 Tax=Streptomyces sp. NPDC046203 TaxID=3154602 RepID=UPI0033DE3F45
MANRKISVPAHAIGLAHRDIRLRQRFTIICNRLAQHEGLSLMAIGLAVHLQSLPAGALVGIKAIAAKFPESELRVARAMRELEKYGYLERFRERLPNGTFISRAISYNRPKGEAEAEEAAEAAARRELELEPEFGAEPVPEPEFEAKPEPEPELEPVAEEEPTPVAACEAPAPTPEVPATEAPAVPVAAPAALAAPVEQPIPRRCQQAAELLVRLRVHDPRLLLSVRDIERLAPGLTTWLDRGAHPDAVLRTLSASLPHDLRHPAALLAHRLTNLLPPPLPAAPRRPDVFPLQTCDGCERAFRAPEPGHCRDCRPPESQAA